MGAGRVQYAALPYQKTAEGLQTLLITSRETRRWIAPKGWPTRSKASAVRWNVASQIAWVVVMPAAAIVGALVFEAARLLGGLNV